LSLISSDQVSEKIGGIVALRELIDANSAAAETKLIKFATALSDALKCNSEFGIIELIANALGCMAKSSLISHLDFIERELRNALDWLGSYTSHRRFAACVILQQLAENAPTIFFMRVKEFFDNIWGPMCDTTERTRHAASEALSACLAVLVHRTYHLFWYCQIFEKVSQVRGAAIAMYRIPYIFVTRVLRKEVLSVFTDLYLGLISC